MKKFVLALSIALCAMCSTGFAAEQTVLKEEAEDKPVLAQRIMPEHMEAPKEAIEENAEEIIAKMRTDRFVEIINTEEMQKRLYDGPVEDFLYLKLDEGNVLVYQALLGDKASCAELIQASPREHIINAYTNCPELSKQMWKVIKSNKGEWKAVGGYTVVGAKSPDVKLERGIKISKFWYEKVKSDNRRVKVRRRGLGLPIPIGINIPIGGGHHRPRIGIGL